MKPRKVLSNLTSPFFFLLLLTVIVFRDTVPGRGMCWRQWERSRRPRCRAGRLRPMTQNRTNWQTIIRFRFQFGIAMQH